MSTQIGVSVKYPHCSETVLRDLQKIVEAAKLQNLCSDDQVNTWFIDVANDGSVSGTPCNYLNIVRGKTAQIGQLPHKAVTLTELLPKQFFPEADIGKATWPLVYAHEAVPALKAALHKL